MRVVFMGTPEFAVPVLEAVSRVHEVVSVYTRPDAPSGRGNALRPSPVKDSALLMGLDVRQPATLRDPEEHRVLAAIQPDVVVVAAYGMILPREILAIPEFGCVNVHGSLLPRWRGAAPIQRAILAGDETTGVSIMRMEEGLDTGPYCSIAALDVGESNAAELSAALATLGAETLLDALESIEDGSVVWAEQDSTLATYAEKIAKSEIALDPSLAVVDAVRRVRASSPQAPARAIVAGRGVTVERARIAPGGVLARPGGVAWTGDVIVLGMCDGDMEVDQVKPDGKKSMKASEWARGLQLDADSTWEAV